MRSSAAAAAAIPAWKRNQRCTSARIRLVVTRIRRVPTAARRRPSASAWRASRTLKYAIQAPLSTNTLRSCPPGPIRWRPLRNIRLVEVVVEPLAAVGRQVIDHAAGCKEGVALERSNEGAYRRSHDLGLRPPPRPRPGFEPGQVVVVEIDLQWPAHEHPTI